MTRVRDIIILSLVLAGAPLATATTAAAQAPAVPSFAVETVQIDGYGRDKARQDARGGRRLDLSDIVRMVQAGRPGRMLGVRPQGDNYVVRWEYEGGRIVDITVDGRTGRVIGER